MSPCPCHEPDVFGHRCLGEPTGRLWPDGDYATPEDMRELFRRMGTVSMELDELEHAIAGLHDFVRAGTTTGRDTYSWLDMVRLMRKGRR